MVRIAAEQHDAVQRLTAELAASKEVAAHMSTELHTAQVTAKAISMRLVSWRDILPALHGCAATLCCAAERVGQRLCDVTDCGRVHRSLAAIKAGPLANQSA